VRGRKRKEREGIVGFVCSLSLVAESLSLSPRLFIVEKMLIPLEKNTLYLLSEFIVEKLINPIE